jgi:hypothetical protein
LSKVAVFFGEGGQLCHLQMAGELYWTEPKTGSAHGQEIIALAAGCADLGKRNN